MIQEKRLIIVGILLLTIGFLSGWLGFLLFGDIAGQARVLFVSMEAIIRLEEERIAKKPEKEKTLFFSKKEGVLERIEAIAKTFEDRRTKVVFVSNNSGKILGGEGISELIHQELLKELEKE